MTLRVPVKNWVPGFVKTRRRRGDLPQFGDLPYPARGVVTHHARRLARSYYRVAQFAELAQEGIVAAHAILPGFDPARGSAVTYFTPRVRGAMLDYLRCVHPFGTGAARLEGRAWRSGGASPVPGVVPLPLLELEYGDRPAPEALYTYDPEHADSPAAEFRAVLHALLPGTSPVEREVLVEHFARGRTMREIALTMGCSEARVCNILNGALARARERNCGR